LRNAATLFAVVNKLGVPGRAASSSSAQNKSEPILLALGQEGPTFSEDVVDAAHFHGADGLGGTHTSHPQYTPLDWEDTSDHTLPDDLPVDRGYTVSPRPAHDEIIHLLRTNDPNTISIVAIGPLTNIAKAALADPATFSRVKEVIVMGGALALNGNATPFAEFNIFADPEAAALVFSLTNIPNVAQPTFPGFDHSALARLERPVKVTLLPLDITRKHPIYEREWQQGCTGSELAEWVNLFTSNSFRVLNHRDTEKCIVIHDALCIWYVLHSDDGDSDVEKFEVKTLDVRIETQGEWTRGMCCVDQRRFLPSTPEKAKEGLISKWVDPGSWRQEGQGNRVRVLTTTPGQKAWVKTFLATFAAV
jgi:inosine-uridine nucleoside N-ribohydrolase